MSRKNMNFKVFTKKNSKQNIDYLFYKQPCYKQQVLRWQINK